MNLPRSMWIGDNCVEGCDIACACNYNPDINTNVALCEFDGCSGCTYEGAPQYDETATTDDGSCTFEFANPCPADLNGDGSVSTADLLEFLIIWSDLRSKERLEERPGASRAFLFL